MSSALRRIALLLAFPICAIAADTPVIAVNEVNLARYLGRWYEVASFPMFFQKRCLGDTTAEYALRPDGDIAVTNRCRTEDGFIEANGRASVVASSGNARLKVSFFWPFSSDYWVIGLDADYRWAVVGNPNRKTLWILSRTPTLSEDDLLRAKATATAQGYDLASLRTTAQSEKIPAEK